MRQPRGLPPSRRAREGVSPPRVPTGSDVSLLERDSEGEQ